MCGFRFTETMSGTAFVDGQERPMHFHITASADDVLVHLRSGRARIEGDVHIDGLVQAAPLTGTLWLHLIRPFFRSIRYEFSFVDDRGRALWFVGQKDLSMLAPLRTLTNLPGELRDARGERVGTASLRFSLRDLPGLLLSFRPVLAPA
jgi:hypothetical protein